MGREDEGSDLWEWMTPRGLFFVFYVRRAIVFSLKTQRSTGIIYYPVTTP